MCPRLNESKATSLSVKLLTNLICNYFMETWQQLYFILWRQYKNKIILKLIKIRNRLQLSAGMSANKLTIIGRGWEKYRDLSVASRSNISRSRRLRRIIVCETLTIHDILPCFMIIRLPNLIFKNIFWKRSDLPFFTQERSQGEKRGFDNAWAQHYLQPNTVERHWAWADHYL